LPKSLLKNSITILLDNLKCTFGKIQKLKKSKNPKIETLRGLLIKATVFSA